MDLPMSPDPPCTVEPLAAEHPAGLAEWAGPTELERARAAAAADPLGALVAVAGGRPVALAIGTTTPRGFRIVDVRWAPDRGPRDVTAVLAHVRQRFPGRRIEASTRIVEPGTTLDDPREAALEGALETAGLAPAADQIHVERGLGDLVPPGPDPFTYRAAAEVGRAALLDLLAAIIPADQQARRRETVAERLDGFVAAATRGDELDASLWQVAAVDGETAGVALAQLLAPGVGTLLYCGLVPAWRGRGFGAALHAHALDRLRRAGAEGYVDTTTRDNLAMQRVFARHGCAIVGRSRLWVLIRPPPAPWLDDLDALAAALRATDHEVEVLDPSGWLRTRARAGADEAVLDLIWLRDRHLVQVVCVAPVEIPADAMARCAAATCAANAALDVPGFAIDEPSRTLRYQIPIWLDERGRLPAHPLRRAIATAVRTMARSVPWWERVSRGDDLRQPPPAGAWTAPWID